jgi:hypothetical protein
MHLAPCFFAPVGLNTRGELTSARELHHRDGCDCIHPQVTTLSPRSPRVRNAGWVGRTPCLSFFSLSRSADLELVNAVRAKFGDPL